MTDISGSHEDLKKLYIFKEFYEFFKSYGNIKNMRSSRGACQFLEGDENCCPSSLIWWWHGKIDIKKNKLMAHVLNKFESPIKWYLELEDDRGQFFPERLLRHTEEWLEENDPDYGRLVNYEYKRLALYLSHNHFLRIVK